MLGYKVYLQDGGEIREGLICSYCKLLLKDPVQTSESGLRLCRGCFEEASSCRDPSFASKLDQNDEAWPDSAVKREISNLKVKCENYIVGCDWEGLFKQLMQHSQQCQYVTVECRNPGCGQQVLLTKMEEHLKQQCPQRQMHFIELKDHAGECPNAPKTCKNCKKKIPASKLADHMIHECKHVRCVCKNDGKTYEAGSTKFHSHLQDVNKLADHLGPMICEFTKMSEAFKEMSTAYQQATKRIAVLEKGHQEDVQRIVMLENNCLEYTKRIEVLEKQNGGKTSEGKVSSTSQKGSDEIQRRMGILEKRWGTLHNEVDTVKRQLALVDHEPSERFIVDPVQKLEEDIQGFKEKFVKHDHADISSALTNLKERVLELERTLNVISVHHSELELQLQASLASTHNGAFLWRIPEVRRRIRDAKMGRITSIYSPPFYTGRNGYKMCIRAYLNGDGTGEGTHLSIFFVLMKGEYDPLLQWPFESKVSFILVDQDHMKHLVQTFKPNAQSSSFQRPKTDMNIASGCPEFADLSILDNTSYVKDDFMYIKAIVDTSKIFHP